MLSKEISQFDDWADATDNEVEVAMQKFDNWIYCCLCFYFSGKWYNDFCGLFFLSLEFPENDVSNNATLIEKRDCCLAKLNWSSKI